MEPPLEQVLSCGSLELRLALALADEPALAEHFLPVLMQGGGLAMSKNWRA